MDFDYEDEEGDGRDITIFGFTRSNDVNLDSETLSRDITTFINSAQSRLEMVIHLFSDSYRDRIFVPEECSKAVAMLLQTIGVTPKHIVRTLPYSRLNSAALENPVSQQTPLTHGCLLNPPACFDCAVSERSIDNP